MSHKTVKFFSWSKMHTCIKSVPQALYIKIFLYIKVLQKIQNRNTEDDKPEKPNREENKTSLAGIKRLKIFYTKAQ